MKNVRVRELEDLSNDFLKKLREDEDEKIFLKRPIKTENNTEVNGSSKIANKRNLLNLPDFSITHLYKKKNRKKEEIVIIYININIIKHIVPRCI